MVSAIGESAAQFKFRSWPVVKGVPAHWLKCRWFRFRIISSRVSLSYTEESFPFVCRWMNVTPGLGGLSIHRSLR